MQRARLESIGMRGLVGVGAPAQCHTHGTEQVVVDVATADECRVRLPTHVAQRLLLLGIGWTLASHDRQTVWRELTGLGVALVHQAETNGRVAHALGERCDRTGSATLAPSPGVRTGA